MRTLRRLGLLVVGLYFFFGGVGHFVLTPLFEKIVPPYVPWPVWTVYITGALEILGAVGLCSPRWRQAAGYGLMALTICVTPANVYMWRNPELFPTIDPALLFWRLPVQGLLLALIWWTTQGAMIASKSRTSGQERP